ncbi:MAG: hypothetical protein HYY76_14400 [Acidobacteria bacterium]|nr:hypothetical protein [Acidobacteriota bacterium]
MSRSFAIALLAASVTTAGCGATRTTTRPAATLATPLTSATMTFITREDGKDADSAVTVQLLRNNAEIGAELRTDGTEFDDNTTSAPMSLALSAPFRIDDIDEGQLRVRLAPDGQDDWSFDLRMSMHFADGTVRTFVWNGIRLNNAAPERVLALAPARVF